MENANCFCLAVDFDQTVDRIESLINEQKESKKTVLIPKKHINSIENTVY